VGVVGLLPGLPEPSRDDRTLRQGQPAICHRNCSAVQALRCQSWQRSAGGTSGVARARDVRGDAALR